MGFLAALTIVLSVCFWVAVAIGIMHGMNQDNVILIIITLIALMVSFTSIFIISYLKDVKNKKPHQQDKDTKKKGKYHENK